MNLAALLFDVARLLPDRLAVSDGRHSWNYRELIERAARIGGALRARGLVPGDRVLLSLENCSEFFELLFGCWAAGLCAVPANARLHPREIAYIARHSGARVLFATSAIANALADVMTEATDLRETIVLGSADHAALLRAEPVDARPVARDAVAWLFYTSGTTGRPKGAMLPHGNLLVASHCYYADIERVEPGHAMLHAAPLSHGAGLYGVPHLF